MKKLIHIITFVTLCGMPFCSYRSTANSKTGICNKIIWGNSSIVENTSQAVGFQKLVDSKGQLNLNLTSKSNFLMTGYRIVENSMVLTLSTFNYDTQQIGDDARLEKMHYDQLED